MVVATLALGAHAGADALAFQGRVSRSRRLRPGTDTAVFTATDGAGHASAPARLTFTTVGR